jgi:hypothetical protein
MVITITWKNNQRLIWEYNSNKRLFKLKHKSLSLVSLIGNLGIIYLLVVGWNYLGSWSLRIRWMTCICLSIKCCGGDLDKGLKYRRGWGVCGLWGRTLWVFLILLNLSSCSFSSHECCSLWGSTEKHKILREWKNCTYVKK